MEKNTQKINGWDQAYKKEPQQFTEPEKICSLTDTLFPKYGVKRILDLGCGNGRHLVYYGKKGYQIFGSDLSGWGLQAAQQWTYKEKISTPLTLADMQYLPFSDDSFDAIISFRVIQHNLFADILATFKEIERVLRKDGLLVMDLLRHDPNSERLKDSDILEPGTHAPRSGTEKGMPHHAFTKTEIFQILNTWNIKLFDASTEKRHSIIIAQR